MSEPLASRATSLAERAPPAVRNFNLDAVRAAAITMVVLAHAAVMSPVRHPFALSLAWVGQFGVDLFFVLSGWLIGGLFWKEWRAHGTVRWPRFFLRRALRTIPPYLAILPVAWLAVHLFAPQRGHFDIGYLFFLQNYYQKLPYFSVSWSLCVEEHFYLFLPALVLLALRVRSSLPWLFAALVILSPLCRIFCEDTTTVDVFDRSVLATHLRLEGLVLGFWASYVHRCRPEIWARIAPWFSRVVWPALALVLLSPWVPSRLFYDWGFTGLAMVFLILVGHAASSPAWRLPAAPAVRLVAGMSYSIYLTHSLVLHVARAIASHGAGWAEWVYWPFVILAVVVVGYGFYVVVERTTLRLRDRLMPFSL